MKALISTVMLGCVLLGCSTFKLRDNWTREDTYREAALVGISTIDVLQTLDFLRQPNQYHETNPVLGPHPHKDQVMAVAAGSLAAHFYLANLIPDQDDRQVWQYIWIGVEAEAVSTNWKAGFTLGW